MFHIMTPIQNGSLVVSAIAYNEKDAKFLVDSATVYMYVVNAETNERVYEDIIHPKAENILTRRW